MIDHPFIQEFKGYKQDVNRYYIFTKFVNGMDLFSFLRELKIVMPITEARFYIS